MSCGRAATAQGGRRGVFIPMPNNIAVTILLMQKLEFWDFWNSGNLKFGHGKRLSLGAIRIPTGMCIPESFGFLAHFSEYRLDDRSYSEKVGFPVSGQNAHS